jgi:uncharacterized protein YpmS
MVKWFKRLVLLLVFAGVFAITLAGVAWWLSQRPPAWLVHRGWTHEEMAAAAQRAERQMERTLNWAQDQQAYAASSRVGTPSTHPTQVHQISFTQDELNGFFQKWDASFGWSKRYEDYLSDPQLVIHEGRLILAATVKSMGAVVSIEFQPRLEGGKLNMPVERVLAGQLPLPAALWNSYRAQLETKAARMLPDWQQGAELLPNGSANPDAVKAGMSELLIDILEDRPARPILFLPASIDHAGRCLAVKLTGVEIGDQSLTLTIEPVPIGERPALLEAIRNSNPVQTAEANEAVKQ